MLEEIKTDLADNFREGDDDILQEYIDRVTADALSISNREETEDNINLLKSEIKQCVKALYLQRGGEGSKGISGEDKRRCAGSHHHDPGAEYPCKDRSRKRLW